MARRQRQTGALALVVTWHAGTSGAAVPSLDPETYREPQDGEYWGGSASSTRPFTEERLKSAELDRAGFDKRIMDGQVFVVEDAGKDWPMDGWDCEYFRNDPVFGKAEMNQQYAAGGGAPFVGFKSDWMDSKTASGAKDKDAPQVAPFYWGIKDVQYPDAQRSKTWKKAMLKKVQEHIRLPRYMDTANKRNFETTPEFWFAAGGAGAKAHMDTHVQATMSLQLSGTKRWRLSVMDERTAPFLAMIYKDGDVYERSEAWQPQFNLTLKPGEALFFPPGFIHETLNLGEADSCSASVTFQFTEPMAVGMYRRFLPRVRRTADIHEAWPMLKQWATLKSKADKKGMAYADAKSKALGESGAGAAFRKRDKDGDGFLSNEELNAAFGQDAKNMLGFHDLDEDGRVAREEFAEVFALWAGTVKAAYDDTPPKHRQLQLKDMEADFNIEDVAPKLQRQLMEASFKLEKSRQHAGGASSTDSEL
mmetsp:Transcript_6758/g.25412  ORF Transcript_6758/g.25412 Transcript_6758/m.25412 type:complete len:477 (+) Transcript_6758:61-1491(+)